MRNTNQTHMVSESVQVPTFVSNDIVVKNTEVKKNETRPFIVRWLLGLAAINAAKPDYDDFFTFMILVLVGIGTVFQIVFFLIALKEPGFMVVVKNISLVIGPFQLWYLGKFLQAANKKVLKAMPEK